MSTALPANQAVKRTPLTSIDQELAKLAETYNRSLHFWIEQPLSVVSFRPSLSAWFKLEPVHRMTISDLKSHPLGQGDEIVLDFGSHRVGYLSFFLDAIGDNIDAPCRLRFIFGEVPTDVVGDLGDVKTWISTSWLPDEIVNVDWLPCNVSLPRRYSFRYVRIEIIDTSQKYQCLLKSITVKCVSAVSQHIFDSIPEIETNDDFLKSIDKVSRVTLRDCMHTVFEDGPRRDRRLWLGDLRIQALTNYATFRNFKLVKRCLYMFAACAGEDGGLPACVFEFPVLKAASDYIVDYDALFGVIVYEYVLASGDRETGKKLWKTILGSLKIPLQHVNPDTNAFESARTDLWKFLDWDEGLHRDAGLHALLLFSLNSVGELAKLLQQDIPFADVAERMKEAAIDVFFKREITGHEQCCQNGVFISGPNKQVSWLSCAWMVLAGVIPHEESRCLLFSVMHCPRALKPLCPYGWAVFAEALAKVNAKAECVNLLKTYWGGMIERGADTFWECYDPNDAGKSPYGDVRNNSYCHAWSCSPAWIMRDLLGMDMRRENGSERDIDPDV